MTTTNTPSPRISRRRDTLHSFRDDPVSFLRRIAAEQGDVATFSLDGRVIKLLAHPEAIREVLVTKAAMLAKGPGLLRTKSLLGDGLLTADGVQHQTDRRNLLPAFSTTAALAEYAPIMVDATRKLTDKWRDGETVDVHAETTRLAIAIASRCFFGIDLSSESEAIAAAVTASIQHGYRALTRNADDNPSVTAAHAAHETLRSAARQAMTTCPMHSPPFSDGLATIPEARKLDHALTILIAGHESLSNTLTWAFYLIDQHPEVWAKLKSEVDTLNDADFDTPYPLSQRLPYARAVFAETLRLYPSAWMLSREAREPVEIAGTPYDSGAIVVTAPCVTHVDARWFPDPLSWRPERWLTGERVRRNAFFPFGSGPRLCVGEPFSWVEGVLVLALVTRHSRLKVAANFCPDYEALVTLRPRHRMIATVSRP
ncbi:MAG TPA: cytochrome P450 [Capsulimonadaceae bacterium]|jgi:cytochrome P450